MAYSASCDLVINQSERSATGIDQIDASVLLTAPTS